MKEESNLFFSIVIPLFNSENFIIDTIRSVENQYYKNFELIIVDDHSTDNSYSIVDNYIKKKKRKHKLIKRPANIPKGVAGCRNYGIHLSNGEWICFLDSDDIFHKDKLKIILNYVGEEYAIHSSVDIISEDGVSLNSNKIHVDERIGFKTLLKRNVITTSTVCIKKEVFNEFAGFDTDLHGVEDYLLWLQVAKIYSWFYIDKPLTKYRKRSTSLMGARQLSYYVNEINKLYKKANKGIYLTDQEKAVFYNNLFYKTMRYYISISLNKYGYYDFLRGVLNLVIIGRIKCAFKFLYLVNKQKSLRFFSFIKTKLVP